jgi:hypothetical protein
VTTLLPNAHHHPPPYPKFPPSALHDEAKALGVDVSVNVHSTDSVLVTIVLRHTAVDTVSVGVGAVMVSYSIPSLTVIGGSVE